MDSSQNRYQALALRLREHADKFPPELQRLGDALWNEADEPPSHAACLEQLPAYIDAELAGQPVARIFPAVKHHLDRCDTCGQEYAGLLETEWAEQRGVLAKPETIPYPDLSFLPPSRSQLETLVLKYARAVLAVLDPKNLPNLDAVAAAFFAPPKPGQALEERAVYTVDLDNAPGGTGAALTTLAASYATTQSIAAQVTRAQFDSWTGQARIKQNVEPLADASARAIGLNSAAAASFARVYAEQIEQEPASLRAQLSESTYFNGN